MFVSDVRQHPAAHTSLDASVEPKTVLVDVRDDAGGCAPVRASAPHATTCTTCQALFTTSLRNVHTLVRVEAWSCVPPDTVTCSSRLDGTSSSRLIHTLHELFAHGTNSSQRVWEQFTTTAQQCRSRQGVEGIDSHFLPFHNLLANRQNAEDETNTRKSKAETPQAERPENTGAKPEPETAERDESPQSSIASIDVIPETQQDSFDTQRQPSSKEEATQQQKKRVWVSKKEIPECRWTNDGEKRLADLIKEYPKLYEQLDPPATGPHTRVGKNLKREKKSGVVQPERGARDDGIMETWSFLIQHIAQGKTVPSEQLAVFKSATVTSSDDEDVEVMSTGSQSQASSTTGKGKGKGKRSRPPTTETATTPTVTATTSGIIHTDLNEDVWQILSKADSLGASHSYTGHQKIVHDSACLLEGHMQGIPEESWYRPWTTEWEPRMPPAPSASPVQAPSPTHLVSPSAIFKTPVTSLSFPGLTPGLFCCSSAMARAAGRSSAS
ncbi:hypothetical protein E2C01_030737 [Portunus trituberculatus]|uniref:Uncharacterized protein n=1 Tax=Portunus trituberculatus TaxID=210409 RepID=A0A5B7EWL7_PORTR|nr:hypothetical protein [Portunus trituberculatus]